MDAFEPLINLLVLLGTLSIAAERLANLTKLAHPDLARRRGSQREEKDRERRIGNRVILVSVLLATAIKADFFAIMAHLDAPWQTLGWSRGAAPGSFAALPGTPPGPPRGHHPHGPLPGLRLQVLARRARHPLRRAAQPPAPRRASTAKRGWR